MGVVDVCMDGWIKTRSIGAARPELIEWAGIRSVVLLGYMVVRSPCMSWVIGGAGVEVEVEAGRFCLGR